MRATDLAIRRCIDRFADDLIEIANQEIRARVAVALSQLKTSGPLVPAKRRKAAQAPKAQKEAKGKRAKLSALEKLERAQARRKERAETKKREQLALPFSGDEAKPTAENGAAEAPVEAAQPKPRGRRKASAANGESNAKVEQAAAPPPPPPLFVVKRTRDGSIQALQRKSEDSATNAQAEAQNQPPPN